MTSELHGLILRGDDHIDVLDCEVDAEPVKVDVAELDQLVVRLSAATLSRNMSLKLGSRTGCAVPTHPAAPVWTTVLCAVRRIAVVSVWLATVPDDLKC